MKNLSQKFRNEFIPDFDKFRPEYIFAILGIKVDKENKSWYIPNSQQVPNTDRIYDPYGGESGTGAEVDIWYSTGTRKMDPNRKSEDFDRLILPDIFFRKAEVGQIVFRSGSWKKGRDKGLLEYLWVCNFNKANAAKPFHIQPLQYIFTYINTQDRAERELLKQAAIATAKNQVISMREEDLNMVAEALMPNAVNQDSATKRLFMLNYAEAHPNEISRMSNDETIIAKSLIKNAEGKGIIYFQPEIQAWRFKSNNEIICNKQPGSTQLDSLVAFLITPEGKNYQNVIKEHLAAVDRAIANTIASKSDDNINVKSSDELKDLMSSKKPPHPKPQPEPQGNMMPIEDQDINKPDLEPGEEISAVSFEEDIEQNQPAKKNPPQKKKAGGNVNLDKVKPK